MSVLHNISDRIKTTLRASVCRGFFIGLSIGMAGMFLATTTGKAVLLMAYLFLAMLFIWAWQKPHGAERQPSNQAEPEEDGLEEEHLLSYRGVP